MNCTADVLKALLQTAYPRDVIETKSMGKATYYRVKEVEKTEAIAAQIVVPTSITV
jgi:hypothetical protein